MKRILVLLSGGLLLSGAAFAAVLLPNASQNNPALGVDGITDFTVGLPAAYGSYVLVDSLVSADVGDFGGSVTTNVWRDLDSTLTFEYMFTNTGLSGTRDLIRATIGDVTQPWKGYMISDAGSDASGSSTDTGGGIGWTDGKPNLILRDPTASGEGLTIQFRAASDGTVLRNTTADFSALIWFDTDALDYQRTDVGLLDSGLIASAESFAPLFIPEPASMALFGLLGLGLIRRRR